MSTLIELFTIFFKLGAFTIGGGIAMLPLLQHSLTEEREWFTKEEFVDIIAVCQSLPGVVAINMATYVGYSKKGLIGSIVSTLGVATPSFCMILALAKFISSIGDNPVLNGAMAGFRAAALGLIIVSIIQLSSAVFKGKWTIIAAVLSFVLIAVCNINTAYVVLIFMILGIASALVSGARLRDAGQGDMTQAQKSAAADTEKDKTMLSEAVGCDETALEQNVYDAAGRVSGCENEEGGEDR